MNANLRRNAVNRSADGPSSLFMEFTLPGTLAGVTKCGEMRARMKKADYEGSAYTSGNGNENRGTADVLERGESPPRPCAALGSPPVNGWSGSSATVRGDQQRVD